MDLTPLQKSKGKGREARQIPPPWSKTMSVPVLFLSAVAGDTTAHEVPQHSAQTAVPGPPKNGKIL